MIAIKTDRVYTAYYRTNRRTQWRYADYAGCWESVERAIEEVTSRIPAGEYRIENHHTGEVLTGTIA